MRMVRRLLSFAIAFVTLAAPVATEVCQATCASRDAQASVNTESSHHSCHEAAAPQSGQAIGAVHFCGHEDGVPTALERATHVVQPPAAAVSTMAVVAEPSQVLSAFAAPFDSSPPTPLNLISQLRV